MTGHPTGCPTGGATGSVAGSSPYPWPFDGDLDVGVAALVVTGAGAAWARLTPDDPDGRRRVGELRAAWARLGGLTVLVAHDPPGDRALPAPEPAPALEAGPGDVAVTAAGVDGFYGSALDATLRRGGRSHLVVCGYGLESTVHSTLRRANDRGYECVVALDAALAHDPALAAAAASTIEMSGGIFGAVATAAAIAAAYAPGTAHPRTADPRTADPRTADPRTGGAP